MLVACDGAMDLTTFRQYLPVPRSHLRRLLEGAFEIGLLQTPPRNGAEILLNEIRVAAFLNCMVSALSFYQGNALAK